MMHIVWAASYNSLYLAALIPLGCIVLYRCFYSLRIMQLLTENNCFTLLQYTSRTRLIVKAILLFTAFSLLFVTLLRPQWGKKEETVPQQGRNIFVVLDISRSMLAQDLKPNRLSCAKVKIKSLLHVLASERVGLILFSGLPFVQCPLTTDYQAFYMFLDQIDADTVSSGTTSLDKAIAKAIEAFKVLTISAAKVLIIFTDGEDFSSNLAQLKKEAEQEGIIIFTVGMATEEGAPIPLLDATGKGNGHQKDKKGNIVISKLNEGILQTLAHDVGGTYISVTSDNRDMLQLKNHLERIEQEKFEERTVAHEEDQYPLFLFLVLLCLALEWIL